jgi:hypothetical protein
MAAALAITLQSAAVPACVRDGDTVEGEFRYVVTRHHGEDQHVPFVVTERPFCFAPVIIPAEPSIQGRWIQIHWSDERTVDPAPGDAVTMTVQDCNEPGTSWHIGDIICDARLRLRDVRN